MQANGSDIDLGWVFEHARGGYGEYGAVALAEAIMSGESPEDVSYRAVEQDKHGYYFLTKAPDGPVCECFIARDTYTPSQLAQIVKAWTHSGIKPEDFVFSEPEGLPTIETSDDLEVHLRNRGLSGLTEAGFTLG